jgi:hypothetical protein
MLIGLRRGSDRTIYDFARWRERLSQGTKRKRNSKCCNGARVIHALILTFTT